MSGTNQLDIDQTYERLVALATRAGAETHSWTLSQGGGEAIPRTPWRIVSGERTVLTLGYTRRDVLSTLLAMNSVLAVVLGA